MRDLNFLADAPIEFLSVSGNPISDLTPLRGKPLKLLQLPKTITDLSPLRGTPIEKLESSSQPKDLSPLLDLPKLEKLRESKRQAPRNPSRPPDVEIHLDRRQDPYRPVAEFWAEYDAQQAAVKSESGWPSWVCIYLQQHKQPRGNQTGHRAVIKGGSGGFACLAFGARSRAGYLKVARRRGWLGEADGGVDAYLNQVRGK